MDKSKYIKSKDRFSCIIHLKEVWPVVGLFTSRLLHVSLAKSLMEGPSLTHAAAPALLAELLQGEQCIY